MRGPHGAQLVISYAHTGLKTAVASTLLGASWQTLPDPFRATRALGTAGTVPSEVRVDGGWPGRWSTATESR